MESSNHGCEQAVDFFFEPFEVEGLLEEGVTAELLGLIS